MVIRTPATNSSVTVTAQPWRQARLATFAVKCFTAKDAKGSQSTKESLSSFSVFSFTSTSSRYNL